MKKMIVTEQSVLSFDKRFLIYKTDKSILSEALKDYEENFTVKNLLKTSDGFVGRFMSDAVLQARWFNFFD